MDTREHPAAFAFDVESSGSTDLARYVSHSHPQWRRHLEELLAERDAQLALLRQQISHLTRVALLGELSGALAHELQQPLTAILCNAQAAQQLVDAPQIDMQELRATLRDIVADDMHAGQIIAHLRDLLIRGETHMQRLVIADLLPGVLTLTRGTLDKCNVAIECHVARDIPTVMGDRVELQQVLLNLLMNACESVGANASGNRRIEISVTHEPNQGAVQTSVLDSGRGIAGDQLERIFDAFYTTKSGGLGLGLAVCRTIILAHKGQLWATNRSCRGAAFHFTLPAAAQDVGQ
jgi:two-component system, LuxR family, sensor kinase FixL